MGRYLHAEGAAGVAEAARCFKMIAAGACCESARDQKDRKPKRSPEKWQSQRRPAHEKGNTFWIDMGLTKAGFLAGLTTEFSGKQTAKLAACPLERIVRTYLD